MRPVVVLFALLAIGSGAIVLSTNVFRPAAAADRLRGVRVAVTGHSTDDLGDHRHRLRLTIAIDSQTDIDQCIGFTLDEPFAGRWMQPESGTCLKPVPGRQTAVVTFDTLTDDDLTFPSHTLVWGIPGGRCGPILETVGVCVVDEAGTADFTLPSKTVLPTFGTFGPLFSFGPYFSLAP
jgi:hypothetical protein